MKRILSVLLVVFLCLHMLTGCDSVAKLWLEDAGAMENLPYTLDQAMLDNFHALIEQTEVLSVAGEDMQAIEEVSGRLEQAYMELIDQSQIAFILYCLDQTDETNSDRYLEATDLVADAQVEYQAMLKRVYLSETPVRDELFAEWTPQEINAMLCYDERIAELEKRNAQLQLEYHALPEADDPKMITLYNEFVQNNNAIAQLYGYDHYYDYAYDMVYTRDYGAQELEQMRAWINQYLLPTYEQVNLEFDAQYRILDEAQTQVLSEILHDPYDQGQTNYVRSYLSDLPHTSGGDMQKMFSQKRAVYTAYRHAYQGAFTTWIDGEPFCYFGTGYSKAETMIHELGHYYGSMYADPWSQPMDLSETQSQGNEWLFAAYLSKRLEAPVHEAYCLYKLSSDMASVVAYCIIDEFERMVYTHEQAGQLSAAQYDQLMEQAAEDFGGIEYIQSEFFDLQAYWKLVVIDSPVYYISYAVSALAAIDLFLTACQDEELARERYSDLCEKPVEDGGFLANIRQAHIAGPFEQTVYEKLYERYGK